MPEEFQLAVGWAAPSSKHSIEKIGQCQVERICTFSQIALKIFSGFHFISYCRQLLATWGINAK